jgi:hypothetical protein
LRPVDNTKLFEQSGQDASPQRYATSKIKTKKSGKTKNTESQEEMSNRILIRDEQAL